jgi:hypothetical protein
MSFKPFVNGESLVNVVCKHKVGDIIALSKDCSNQYGLFQKGTKFVINEIHINDYSYIPNNILVEDLDKYIIDNDIFEYWMKLVDENESIGFSPYLQCYGSFVDGGKRRLIPTLRKKKQ